jgi:elongation factor Tu
MKAVDANIELPERDVKKPFMLPIESVYSIPGRGTVATGKVLQGSIKLNDEIELVGFNEEPIKTNITGIEMFNKTVDKGMAGDNLGILLKGLTKDQVRRGQIVAIPKTVQSSKEFVAECYLLSKEEGGRHTPFFSGFQPQFFFHTADINGSIEFLKDDTLKKDEKTGKEMAMPGDRRKFKINLRAPMPVNIGLPFAMREGGVTIGAGRIVELTVYQSTSSAKDKGKKKK